MTQEEKQLLLVDLCGRIPYGVKVLIPECRQDAATLIGVDDKCFAVKYGSTFYCPFHVSIKPYLRPMSSMTEIEKEEYHNLCYEEEGEWYEFGEWTTKLYFHDTIESIDWLNTNHFDYRGLIEKGLALEAPDSMYKK